MRDAATGTASTDGRSGTQTQGECVINRSHSHPVTHKGASTSFPQNSTCLTCVYVYSNAYPGGALCSSVAINRPTCSFQILATRWVCLMPAQLM